MVVVGSAAASAGVRKGEEVVAVNGALLLDTFVALSSFQGILVEPYSFRSMHAGGAL
jgi:hypothetical protein